MARDDIFLMLQVDEKRAAKTRYSYSRRRREHDFTRYIPVHEFLSADADERSILRSHLCALYTDAARKLDLPTPPPAV